MKDNSSGRIVRSSPGSKRSYNSTGRIRSWVNPTQGQPPSPLPPNGGGNNVSERVGAGSWAAAMAAAKLLKKKKKNTSPLIISYFPPQSQVFLIKKIKKFFVKYLQTFVRFTVNKKRGLFALHISNFVSSYFYWFIFS